MPAAKPRPGSLRQGQVLDLAELLGSEWEGFSLAADGLQHPAWRRPFSCGELKAMFWRCQQVDILEHNLSRIELDAERATADKDAAEERADWYRRQLILESRFGAMLDRLTA
ncbi:hypothetical protein [Thauera sp.]|uniref:hypothetical protein n=1 Tax=Thauera sp. TaxID=1905334 RepID=UPI0039E66F51